MALSLKTVAVDYSNSGVGTTLDLGGETPFFPGMNCILSTAVVVPSSTTFTIETCATDSATPGDWTTLNTITAAEGPFFLVENVQQFIRANVSDTGTGTPQFAFIAAL